jgi:aspartate-semialdehyde dehydrogenase
MNMKNKIPVVVLAATGSVGQRFVSLLANHPWFEVTAVTGSDRTIGQPYGDGCKWLLSEPIPESVRNLTVLPTDPASIKRMNVAFSALPADIAKKVEPEFARAGMHVFSNASAYRRDADVPILLPEVNADHAQVVQKQREHHGWSGSIVTNPNCTSTGLTVALKALQDAFGLNKVFAVSMQALSGAGYPGVASMDIIDNIIPYVGGEEEKVEWEPRKMLGKVEGGAIRLADFILSAHTNRVAVTDGHMVCVSVEFTHPASVEDAIQAFSNYQAPEVSRALPSSPNPVIVVRSETDRPQPRLDRMTGQGMATVVGRVRKDPLFHVKFVVLSHNTIRGAAGGSIYNAELFVNAGLIKI